MKMKNRKNFLLFYFFLFQEISFSFSSSSSLSSSLSSSSFSSYNISIPLNFTSFPLNHIYIKEQLNSFTYLSKGNKHHKAQFKEDIYLYENYFYGINNGIIIESGALDGLLYSTSFMFEEQFNWFSIHIEGHKGHYQALVKNRPNSININAALSNETRIYHYLHHIEPSPVDGILEFMDQSFIQRCHKMYWLHRNNPITSKNYLDDIYGVTFSSILQDLKLPRVDLWVLDVEGAEFAVLQGTFPLKIEIDVIMIEVVRRGIISREREEIDKLFESNGYQCKQHENNNICTRKGFIPSSKYDSEGNIRTITRKTRTLRTLRGL